VVASNSEGLSVCYRPSRPAVVPLIPEPGLPDRLPFRSESQSGRHRRRIGSCAFLAWWLGWGRRERLNLKMSLTNSQAFREVVSVPYSQNPHSRKPRSGGNGKPRPIRASRFQSIQSGGLLVAARVLAGCAGAVMVARWAFTYARSRARRDSA